jgi:hypothetical protein
MVCNFLVSSALLDSAYPRLQRRPLADVEEFGPQLGNSGSRLPDPFTYPQLMFIAGLAIRYAVRVR